MFALGIPKRQYRRTTQVLGPYMSTPTSYDAVKQDDGFYLFTFPEADEDEFRDLVDLLKRNGITTIGADSQLTEQKIMKLTDLIKENNLINLKPLKEQGFDDRLKSAMGMSDDEFEDEVTSRDPGSPFPGSDDSSKGYKEARKLITKLRDETYRKFSIDEVNAFSKEMVLHFLDNVAAEAAVRMRFAKSKPLYSDDELDKTDNLPF